MSFINFTSNENKSIIWGLLQEGGIFNDIPNSYFDNIKRLFEQSITSMKPEFDVFFDKNDEGDEGYDKKASEMIINSNKAVIKKMMIEMGKFKKPQQVPQQVPQQAQHQRLQQVSQQLPIPPRFGMTPESSKMIDARGGGGGKKQKIEEIYRADDLQKHRMSELEVRLKEKQEEMDTMLNTKKPTNIDFSDNGINDNKLASDEMDKLLAQALSSRQRELEQLVVNTNNDNNTKIAEEWITGSNDPVAKALNDSIAIKQSHNIKRPSGKPSQTSTTNTTSTTHKKNVSFSEENNEEIIYDKDVTSRAIEDTASTITNEHDNMSFFSKLKRTSNSTNEVLNVSNVSNISHTFYDNTIPLDDFMTEYDDESEGCRANDNNIYITAREKTRDVIDSRDYAKLDEKINIMQNSIDSIKQTQDRILELLSQK